MSSDLTARVTYAVARARHRSKKRGARAPVVVFSMAKTGSSAVAEALRGAAVGEVFHVHDLDADFLAREEGEYRWSGRPWRIWDAQQLLQRPPTPAAPWRVVSIVREPIAQTVSAFFQPGERRGYLNEGSSVAALLERFDDRLDRLPTRWFETHVEPALGVDVYAHDFDPVAGYKIISTPAVRLLLLRCEGMAVAPAALAELLDTDDHIEVPRVNVGTDKDYADLYASFTQALRPTQDQLERAYASRPVRHFYSPEEIDGFRARWAARSTDGPDR